MTAERRRSRCGGIVLDPVRTSVLPGDCPRHMLPAEGYHRRRSSRCRAATSRRCRSRAPAPPGPYVPIRSFQLFFDFDQDFVIYQYDDYLLDRRSPRFAPPSRRSGSPSPAGRRPSRRRVGPRHRRRRRGIAQGACGTDRRGCSPGSGVDTRSASWCAGRAGASRSTIPKPTA